MAKVKSLDDLFVNLLKDIYYAEKQILKALPKMAKHSESAELEEAFLNHLEETKGQVERLEQVFALCELKPVGKTCPAIKGILEEGQEVMKDAETPLRHSDRLGEPARHAGGGRFAARNPGPGIYRRPYPQRACRRTPQPRSGLKLLGVRRTARGHRFSRRSFLPGSCGIERRQLRLRALMPVRQFDPARQGSPKPSIPGEQVNGTSIPRA
jgi:hypothetical protein